MDSHHISVFTDKSKVDLHQLQALFNLTAFWARERKIEDLALAITHSNPIVSMWDHGRMIGFARATSDGIYRATIWDVMIDPAYQGLGLGRKLMETLLSHPLINQVERVYLMTTCQQEFYKHIGFQENTTTTMIMYNSEAMNPLQKTEQQLQQILEVRNIVAM